VIPEIEAVQAYRDRLSREAESELRAAVRSFLAEEIAAGTFEPSCDGWLGGHDPAFSRRLAARGWVGMTWPRQYGGHERSSLERYTVVEELLAAGAPVAAHWISDRQTGPLLLRYGSEELRQLLLPRMAAGECYFSIGMSEPDSGSDLASIRTSARRVDGGWIVNGTKVWTSHAHRNHYMLTLVRTSPLDETDRHHGMSQLIIDLAGAGVEVRAIRILTGEHHFNEVVLREAFVPDLMLVGEEGAGWRQVLAELAYERSGPERLLSTFPLLTELVRELSTQPSAEATREVGRLAAGLWALRNLSMTVAVALDAGEAPAVQAALTKDVGTRFERELTESVRAVAPAAAGHRLRRLLAESITAGPGFTLRGGTNEILRGIVARGLAGR
jgi:alkylation response protein AidB-like acyl-CoA dehydrogenase